MKIINNYTDYDLFIRRGMDYYRPEKMPTDDYVLDVVMYLEKYGRKPNADDVRQWLIEEHMQYIRESLLGY